MLEGLRELYNYREMLKNLVRKDLRTRYKGSFLGFLWTFINPLLQLLVYSLLFSTIMRMNVEKYPMFLFVALLPWIFFSSSLQISTSVISSNKDLVKKVYFPRHVLPVATVTSGLMNLLFGYIIVIPCLLIFKIPITVSILYLPVIIIVEYILTLGFALLFSSLNVYFRDLEHILNIIIMGWFYLTPIVFPMQMIPQKYLQYFFLNPVTPIINSYRDIFYYGTAPNLKLLAISFVIGILFVAFGFKVFDMLQRNFAEEI